MSAAILVFIALGAFLAGYLLYGGFVARRVGLEPGRPTPAHTLRDGVDYVPARPQILLGHHFSSIAGAAPIVGPIIAAVFGWVPVFLWILLGGILMGAVHDFSALVASVRHEGRSIGEVIDRRLGRGAKTLFLVFAWAALILVIAVFVNVVARTFHKVPQAGTASSLLIGSAVLFGLAVYRFRVPILPATLAGLVLIALTLLAGHHFPLRISENGWKLLLLGYIYVASVTPVWILLQPRDFLNSFLLYALLVAGVAGTLFVNPVLHMKAWTGFETDLGPLFPILFVTVACGALSGFHSLVASGTTAKQLDSEAHARPIAMGAMLIESLLAVVALVTAAMLVPGKYDSQIHEGAVHVFAGGIARFVDAAGGSFAFGLTFASVAVAEFALTSLDTATRIARFAFQELLQVPGEARGSVASLRRLFSRNRFLATTVTVFFGGWLALSGGERTIWPIFGAANQLLAALAFLAAFVWLVHRGRKAGFLAVPTVFMFFVTLGALGWEAVHFVEKKNWILAVLAVFLAVLAVVLAFDAIRVLSRSRAQAASSAPEPE